LVTGAVEAGGAFAGWALSPQAVHNAATPMMASQEE
jgi:hypothetical protein